MTRTRGGHTSTQSTQPLQPSTSITTLAGRFATALSRDLRLRSGFDPRPAELEALLVEGAERLSMRRDLRAHGGNQRIGRDDRGRRDEGAERHERGADE